MKSNDRLKKPLKGVVVLVGFNRNSERVIEENIDVADYYEAIHPLLDDDCKYRLKFGVRQVDGTIYNYSGVVDQHFTNHYGDDGRYIRSRITFADGTVVE